MELSDNINLNSQKEEGELSDNDDYQIVETFTQINTTNNCNNEHSEHIFNPSVPESYKNHHGNDDLNDNPDTTKELSYSNKSKKRRRRPRKNREVVGIPVHRSRAQQHHIIVAKKISILNNQNKSNLDIEKWKQRKQLMKKRKNSILFIKQ